MLQLRLNMVRNVINGQKITLPYVQKLNHAFMNIKKTITASILQYSLSYTLHRPILITILKH